MSALVYVILVGKHAKIGFTTDLAQRLRSFATATAEEIRVLATLPGTRKDEGRLHRSLAESRLPRGEFFHLDYRLSNFVEFVRAGDVESAWRWLDETHPAARARKKEEDRLRRVATARATKAERDASCARLVAERKRRLGW